ncbi:MAG TPA: hypothetical protein VMT58_02135 [Candidatus Binataceae bacterium]|nr:hypothetical protein [Candidatus Binataceae bacterium]
MRASRIAACGFAFCAAIALSGCGHKLVAHNGNNTVALYPDEDTFQKLTELKQKGGTIGGMIGGLGEGIAATQVDNNTRVKILSSDDRGAEVEVLDGTYKGRKGFVAKDNVD